MECPFQGLEYEPEFTGEESQEGAGEGDSAPLDSPALEEEGPLRGKLRERKKQAPRNVSTFAAHSKCGGLEMGPYIGGPISKPPQ